MFPPDVARPAFFYNGNQRNVGKSTLAQSAFAFAFGHVDGIGFKKNEESFEKLLDTEVLEGGPVIFIDNVEGKLQSSALARLITLPRYGFRLLQMNRKGSGENRRVVMMTGNGAKANSDIQSRILSIELYHPGNAEERDYKHPITMDELESAEFRRKFLSAMHSLLSHWIDHKCPRLSGRTKTRFAVWERIIGAMLAAAKLGDPFTAPLMTMDEQTEAWRMCFLKLAALIEPGCDRQVWTIGEIIDIARDHELLVEMLPHVEDERDKINHAFGTYCRKRFFKGWLFADGAGRRCEFRKENDGNKARATASRFYRPPDAVPLVPRAPPKINKAHHGWRRAVNSIWLCSVFAPRHPAKGLYCHHLRFPAGEVSPLVLSEALHRKKSRLQFRLTPPPWVRKLSGHSFKGAGLASPMLLSHGTPKNFLTLFLTPSTATRRIETARQEFRHGLRRLRVESARIETLTCHTCHLPATPFTWESGRCDG